MKIQGRRYGKTNSLIHRISKHIKEGKEVSYVTRKRDDKGMRIFCDKIEAIINKKVSFSPSENHHSFLGYKIKLK